MAAGDIVRWISNSSTVWSTAANWSTGAAPTLSTLAVFDGTGQANVDGEDLSASSALRNIITYPAYTGSIGATGSPLIHNIESTSDPRARIIHRGTGAMYFQGGGSGAAGANAQPYAAVVDSKGTAWFDGDDANGSWLTHLFIKRGTVTVASTCTISGSLNLDGGRAKATVVQKTGDGDVAVKVSAGKLTYQRDMKGSGQRMIIEGGVCQMEGVLDSAGTPAHVYIGERGKLDYRPNAAGTDCNMVVDGALEARSAKYELVFNDYIIGPRGLVMGGGIQHEQENPLSVDIDLREEYP